MVSKTGGKFLLNYPKAISDFEAVMKKFPVKKILYRNIFRGKGLEFDSYRVFEQDDDASFIDWKASLRGNQLLAKKYIEERDLNIYFLIDVSSSMLFGSGNKLKSEFAAEFAAALGHLILGSGDRIGLVMFNDDVVKFLQPGNGKNQFGMFTKFLADESLYGGGFDLKKAIENVLRSVSSPYTIFIVVSDFINTKKDNFPKLKLLGTRFETISVMVRDRLDEELPKGNYQFSVQDPYSGRQVILDPNIAGDRYRKNVVRKKNIVKNMMKSSQIDSLELITDKGFVVPTLKFLRARAMGERI
ncbi:DUF58 domain-containing protein [archaeon]|nr:DUF58 domain-containing protein [archaeon]MBT7128179.1 DUF58 domain-containing protein [archaeon]